MISTPILYEVPLCSVNKILYRAKKYKVALKNIILFYTYFISLVNNYNCFDAKNTNFAKVKYNTNISYTIIVPNLNWLLVFKDIFWRRIHNEWL